MIAVMCANRSLLAASGPLHRRSRYLRRRSAVSCSRKFYTSAISTASSRVSSSIRNSNNSSPEQVGMQSPQAPQIRSSVLRRLRAAGAAAYRMSLLRYRARSSAIVRRKPEDRRLPAAAARRRRAARSPSKPVHTRCRLRQRLQFARSSLQIASSCMAVRFFGGEHLVKQLHADRALVATLFGSHSRRGPRRSRRVALRVLKQEQADFALDAVSGTTCKKPSTAILHGNPQDNDLAPIAT